MSTRPTTLDLLASERTTVVAALLVLTMIGASWINHDFATVQNFRDLLVGAAPAVIVGCGMTFVVLAGEIDVSVGSLMGFLAALMGLLSSPSHAGLHAPVVAASVLLAGAAAGFVNGLLATVARVPSLIATLAMLTILRGATELLLGGEWITDMPSGIRSLGTGTFAGVPFSIWTAAFVAALSILLARRSPAGLRIYAVGGNATAAALSRVPVTRTKLLAFTLVGCLTALSTLVCVSQQPVIESGIGSGFELVVVTAVVVGGTSIRGGRGLVLGTVLAALLLGSIRTTLVFLKLGEMATYWERAIQGAFILAAVLADHLAVRAPREERA